MHPERLAVIRELMAECGAAYARSGEALRLSECAELIERGRMYQHAIEAVLETSGVPSDTLARISEHLDDYVHACNCAGAANARYARTRSVAADNARTRDTEAAQAAREAIEAILLTRKQVPVYPSFEEAVNAHHVLNDGRLHGFADGRFAIIADDESSFTQADMNAALAALRYEFTLIDW